jgi:riboflavin synthase
MNTAVDKCLKPSQEQLKLFTENYKDVSQQALDELKRRKADIYDEQANNVLKSGSETLSLAVEKVIEQEGCEAGKIQALLSSFKMQVE